MTAGLEWDESESLVVEVAVADVVAGKVATAPAGANGHAKRKSALQIFAEARVDHPTGMLDGRLRAAVATALSGSDEALDDLRRMVNEAEKLRAKDKRPNKMKARKLSDFRDDVLAFAKNPRLTTGFPTIDKAVPWPIGEILTVIGGTGRGKSSWALQVARHHEATLGPVLFVSAELAGLVLYARAAAQTSQATWAEVLGGALNAQDLDRAVGDPNFAVIDEVSPDWSNQIRECLAYWAKTQPGKIPLVVIDYYQFVPAPIDASKANDIRARVESVMLEIKSITRSFPCGVLGVSKMSRSSAKQSRDGDMVGSDATEAGAESNVLEYTGAVQLTLGKMDDRDGKQVVELSTSKARFGGDDLVFELEFNGAHGWFREVDGCKAIRGPEVRASRRSEASEAKTESRKVEIRTAVIESLRGSVSGVGTGGLRVEIGCKKTSLVEVIRDLAKQGIVTSEGHGHEHVWVLTEKGRVA